MVAEADTETDTNPIPHGHHYVIAIGIDHYQNWPILGTAVSDATGFAKLLTTQFGFEYAAEPLTEKNATRNSINSLIDDDLRSKLKPEDDLIIFFAGHGTTRTDKVGDETKSSGFLIPFEARALSAKPNWSDYLDVEEFLGKVGSLPSNHILVILDSCHSGMALGSKFTRTRADTRFQRDLGGRVSRKVITSAQGDQLAADAGPVPNHSLFTGLLIQGLTTGAADQFNQGFITATQLGAYTQHGVASTPDSKQTPMFGAFDLDAGGELIIPLGAGAAAPAASSSCPALTQLELSEVTRMKADEHQYWQGNDPLKNFPAARSAALKLCETADAWACGQAANSFRLGLGGGADYQRAAELARQGCLAKGTQSCLVLGLLDEIGQTISPDIPAAARLYRDACAQGNLRGCSNLGNLYLDGKGGIRQDYPQALSLYRRACDGEEMAGCVNLGRMYANGTGVAKDAPHAVSLYRKACDGNSVVGCSILATMYAAGDGVEKDAAQAARLYGLSCDAGVMKGCLALGEMVQNGQGVEKNTIESMRLYRKGCDGGTLLGCTALGAMVEDGDGVEKDAPQAVGLYRKACDGGEQTGCAGLGAAYITGQGVELDIAQAVSLFQRACAGDQMTTCAMLATLYETGAGGVEKDTIQALSLHQKACAGGESKDCIALAIRYENGEGVQKDSVQASRFYRKACDAGDREACTRTKPTN